MQLKDMFVKPIDRDIQGVIIVGQGEETNVAQELEEYVVTKELQKHFADFFAAYKKGILGTTPKMGVWISGFFGSGKSHFLKILSYLLENRKVGDRTALDYFTEDKKITDPMVLADIRLAGETPSDVVLFNIDSKSDTGSKQNKDAIVNVFLRVFNEMQGYCGALPHLADLEQQLTEAGRMKEFEEAFEDEYGKSWKENRHKFDFIQDTVVDVLADMDFMSEHAARNWCEKAAEPYQISIEDFAKRVKAYIDSKGKNHHVVFLVDEIGQYIGEDSKLMLNLQTVTEELGKECKGKAWVIVTSQQDIDSITKVKGNDFSKIQGRFDTRLSLSSANVDAVIKKRILDKTDTAAQTLRLLYEQKATIIKNLIVFNDGVEKKLYSGAKDFTEVYPFIPYQFNLLASVLTSIRTHGASGKHLSEGERSMLALFKESAARLKNEEMGVIVPFHLFYDALENFLDHSHRGVILRAYDNTKINPEHKESGVFAIDVLKTLFMIKYILEIEANVDNITSLMISNIADDRIELRGKVEDALKVLQQQMLVQKNGSIYVFLTDEEQEINREIDSQNVEIAEVINKVSEMIYEDIFKDKYYRYPAFNGRYAFYFNQMVDDRLYKANQRYDIGLRILTPWYEGGNDDTTLRMMSGQGKEVLVVLPNDAAFLEEIRVYLKIEKFLRLNTSVQLTKYETIKEAKRVEMRERSANAKVYLTENLKDAVVYVNGDTVRTGAKEVTGRINEAIGRLVQTVYHKLSYIEEAFGEADIRKMFKTSNQLTLDLEGGREVNTHDLQNELNPKEEDKDVTVRHADLQRDIKSLLSYAVGCMFGRYSHKEEGIVYAGGEWDNSKYHPFFPYKDNIIPITDEEYLEDDIVSRLCEWLKVVYGKETLEENLDFIAKALRNKGSSSREIIRNYFLTDFFKDHCQTYSVTGSGKRPIYWLFDSGKQNGFKALIYLHRYNADTVGNLRIDYLHRMQRIYESEIARMQDMIDNSTNSREVAQATKRKEKLTKQLKECREHDEKLAHLALSRIELNLDDGVKVNYRKLQTANDGKFYEVLADSNSIMTKK